MDNGKCKIGKWKMEHRTWKLKLEKWKVEMESGKWKIISRVFDHCAKCKTSSDDSITCVNEDNRFTFSTLKRCRAKE